MARSRPSVGLRILQWCGPVAVALLTTCLPTEPDRSVTIEFTLPEDTLVLAIGDSTRPLIEVRAGGQPVSQPRVRFESQDVSVATVDSAGNVAGVGRGSVGITVSFVTAASGGAVADTTFPVKVVGADPVTSSITAAPTSIRADGTSTATITVRLRDGDGTEIPKGGDTVALVTTAGSLSAVTDHDDGTYTATLTAGAVTATAVITGTLNAVAIADDAVVKLSAADPRTSSITAAPTDIRVDGTSTATITAQLKDGSGADLDTGGDAVTMETTAGALSAVADNNDGTYTATLTAGLEAAIAAITGTVNGAAITDGASVTFSPEVASVVVAPPGAAVTGGTFTFTAEARDANDGVISSKTSTWSSLNPAIATVDASGTATPVAAGQVTIAAEVDGVVGYGLLTIAVPNATPVNLWANPPSGTGSDLKAVWTRAPNDAWAVGDGGTAVHFDGTSWTGFVTGLTTTISDSWGSSSSDVYAAGRAGPQADTDGVAHYDGQAWSIVPIATVFDALAVWGASPRDVFVSGSWRRVPTGTKIFRGYDGAAWTEILEGGPTSALWGTSTNDVWAAGGGSILRYDGSSWSEVFNPTSEFIWDIWGTSPSDVYISANDGKVFRWDGTSWTDISPTLGISFGRVREIWGTASTDIYAAADNNFDDGQLLHYDGTSWTEVLGDLSGGLYAVSGSSDGSVHLVGQNGSIYRGVRGASVAVTPSAPMLTDLGATVQLSAEAHDASANIVSGVTFSWGSDNQAVATVNANGLVTAAASGTTNITATAPGGASGSATITISLSAASPATSTITAAPMGLPADGSSTATITVQLKDGGGANLTVGGDAVTLATDLGTLSVVTDNTDGSYTAALSAPTTAGTASVSGTVNGSEIADTTTVSFTPPMQSVSAGFAHTCALSTEGTAYCWGANLNGQLGDGTTTGRTTPVAVATALTFQSISAGGSHTCAVASDGAAYCWGANGFGQLGDGSFVATATPVAVGGGHTFDVIDSGTDHTCSVRTDGAAYCWGRNSDGGLGGQLGDGTTTNRGVPVAVAGGIAFRSISAGMLHTCAIATNNTPYCWGDDNGGRLGNAGFTQFTPVVVSISFDFDVVSAGANHTCGVTTIATGWCWGYGFSGEMGDGGTDPRSLPVAVAGVLAFRTISASLSSESVFVSHSCGVNTGDAAYCWGEGSSGQIGDGSSSQRTTPVLVSGGHAFSSVSTGGLHACGVTTVAIIYCWGSNSSGELGDGTTIQRNSPVLVVPP